MAFIPSPQQTAVFDWVMNGSGNAFVQAVAGAGKTTTLIEACSRMTGNVAFAAYNKKIAEEISSKLAAKQITGVFAGTFHSFGFKAWKHFTDNKFLKVDEYKVFNIMDAKRVPEEYKSFVRKLVSLAKQTGIGVGIEEDSISGEDEIRRHDLYLDLVDRHNMDMDLEKDAEVHVGINWAIEVLIESIAQGRKIIDFDDMIYLPVYHGVKMYENDWVLVDEAQDTNNVRRLLAKKMVKPTGRMIWVGDRHQAIYGFTGADADAVDLIVSSFSCKELPLTVTYRCPKEVVSAARNYVAHIEAHETAPVGTVATVTRTEFDEKIVKNLKQTDAILCRKTAPLIKQAYSLIRQGIGCHVEGRDIGKGLLELVNKWKRVKSLDALINQLEKWEEAQVKRAIDKKKEMLAEQIRDRAETLRIIASSVTTLDELRSKITSLFQDTTNGDEKKKPSLTLSTVHKSKGREWGDVYILGFGEYMPSPMAKLPWQKEQENNLIYVGITRAQNSLTLVG